MDRTPVARALALVLFVGIVSALVLHACSPTGVTSLEATARPEPVASGSSQAPARNASTSSPSSSEKPPSDEPSPDYMGASKAAPVFHPHPAPQPPVQPPAQQPAQTSR